MLHPRQTVVVVSSAPPQPDMYRRDIVAAVKDGDYLPLQIYWQNNIPWIRAEVVYGSLPKFYDDYTYEQFLAIVKSVPNLLATFEGPGAEGTWLRYNGDLQNTPEYDPQTPRAEPPHTGVVAARRDLSATRRGSASTTTRSRSRPARTSSPSLSRRNILPGGVLMLPPGRRWQ